MKHSRVVVIGGTGFLGKYVVAKLAREGHLIYVVSRHADEVTFLKPLAQYLGQIIPIRASITNLSSLSTHLTDIEVIINLVGTLNPTKRNTFEQVHHQGAKIVGEYAHRVKAKRLIHISALGIDQAITSRYAQTKLAGEHALLKAFPEVTILRPSLLFGPEDKFFNQLAFLSTVLPFMPMLGKGTNLLQPAYVGDVAQAILGCLRDNTTKGKTFELAGPEIYNFKQLIQKTLIHTGRSLPILSLPLSIAKLMAFFMQILPNPLFTSEQVELLKTNNTLSGKNFSFDELGILPRHLDNILPTYLERYRPTI